jgi:hypothetical protein
MSAVEATPCPFFAPSPAFWADVRCWVKATGLELADALEGAAGEYQFSIRKR